MRQDMMSIEVPSGSNSRRTSRSHQSYLKRLSDTHEERIQMNAHHDSCNLYNLLGVHEDATMEEIDKAYAKKARDMHPTKHPYDPHAQERYQRMCFAYSVLRSTRSRRIYDSFGAFGLHAADWIGENKVDRYFVQTNSWRDLILCFYTLCTGCWCCCCCCLCCNCCCGLCDRCHPSHESRENEFQRRATKTLKEKQQPSKSVVQQPRRTFAQWLFQRPSEHSERIERPDTEQEVLIEESDEDIELTADSDGSMMDPAELVDMENLGHHLDDDDHAGVLTSYLHRSMFWTHHQDTPE